jgi:hypothetical protein
MPALNADTHRVYETPFDTNTMPVAAGAKIFAGSFLGKTDTGYCKPFVAGETYPVGFAMESVDNTNGADGEKVVQIKMHGKVSLFISGITAADVGHEVHVLNDNTFALEGGVSIGKLVRFERADHGIVVFDGYEIML